MEFGGGSAVCVGLTDQRREFLGQVLHALGESRALRAFASLAEAVRDCADSSPAVAVLAWPQAGEDPPGQIRQLRQAWADTPLVLLSAQAANAGPRGADAWLFVCAEPCSDEALAVALHQALTLRSLAEREKGLELAVMGAGLGLWDWHLPSGHVRFNERWQEMLGYRPGQVRAHVSSWEKLVHPEDWARIQEALERHLRGECAWYESEHRLCHADEHWVWVLDKGRVVEWDRAGKPLRLAGIQLDISERKTVEMALLEREAQLEKLLDSLPDAVLHIDPWGSLRYAHLPEGRWFVDKASLRLGAPYARSLPEPVGRVVGEVLGDVLAGNGRSQCAELALTVDAELRSYQMSVSALSEPGAFSGGYLLVFRDQSEQKRNEELIRNLAYYDALTSLPNRRLLLDRLRQAIAVCGRTGVLGALLFIDLDRFKELNDRCGHDIGDRYLVEVAERLRSCLRAGDTAARLGGDEFILMLPDLGKGRGDAFARVAAVCDKILPLLERPFLLDGREYQGSASVGAVLFNGGGAQPEDLLRRADQAMYQAKAAGRRAWRWAENED